MVKVQKMQEIKKRYSAELLSKEGVIGFGVEVDKSGNPYFAVTIAKDDPAILECIPKKIESYPVKIVKSERFKKHSR
jgi:hypothetical protein